MGNGGDDGEDLGGEGGGGDSLKKKGGIGGVLAVMEDKVVASEVRRCKLTASKPVLVDSFKTCVESAIGSVFATRI